MHKAMRIVTAMAVLFILIHIAYVLIVGDRIDYTKVKQVRNGWEVIYNGYVYEDVDLHQIGKIVPGPYKKGDKMELSIDLPETANQEFPTLLLMTKYSAFSVFVDDEQISEYEMERVGTKKFVGCAQKLISLPNNSAGKKLRIMLYVCEDDPFTSMDSPWIGKHIDVETGFMHTNLFPIMSGIFLIVFGVAFAAVTLVFLPNVPEMKEQLFAAFMAMDYGVYTLTFYNVLFFFMDAKYATYMEYISLYLLVPFTVALLFSIHNISRHKKLLYSIGGVISAISVGLIFLHFVYGIHMNRTLTFYHVLSGMAILLVNVIFVKDLITKRLPIVGIVQLGGLAVMSQFLMVGMIIYNMARNGVIMLDFLPTGVFPSGGMLFLMAHLLTYLLYITESYARNQEYGDLERLAYEDALTGLYNRSRSEIFMEELNKKSDDYCLMSLDLNGLKEVNDRFGHLDGDQYIKQFSEVLSSVIGEAFPICRVGGDEFVVFLHGTDEDKVKAFIRDIYELTRKIRLKSGDYPCSAAAGFAFRHEIDNESAAAHDVYMLADERMYTEKRRLHKELGISIREK